MSFLSEFDTAKLVYLGDAQAKRVYLNGECVYALAPEVTQVAEEEIAHSATAKDYIEGSTEWGDMTLSDSAEVSEDGLEIQGGQTYTCVEDSNISYPMTLEFKGRVDKYNTGMLWGMGATNNTWGKGAICCYAHSTYGIIVDSNGVARRISTSMKPDYTHLVYVIHEDGTATLYINSMKYSKNMNADDATMGPKNFFYNGEGKNRLYGAISIMRWWDKELSTSEITALFQNDEDQYKPEIDKPVYYNSTPDYQIDNMVFDGTNYYDTGIYLFDTQKSFKIEVSFTPAAGNTKSQCNTILHCMEEETPYPGLNIDTNGNNHYRIATQTVITQSTIDYDDYTEHTATIEWNKYGQFSCYFDNNEPVEAVLSYVQISNTLLLGGYIDSDGNYGRYWYGTINSLKIYFEAT